MSLIEEIHTMHERIAQRLAELEPLVGEYNDLKEVAAQIGFEPTDVEAASEPEAHGTRSRQRGGGATSRAARPSRSGDLHERLLAAAQAEPGKLLAEYAVRLEVPLTSLYRPARELTTAGALIKRSRQLFPG
jgi:hypothetical protein